LNKNSIISFNQHRILLLFPIVGFVAFLFFFYLATNYYPGGSQFDRQSLGYSWEHNYWCNLLYKHALNGKFNDARKFAIIAMLCLNASVACFWFIFPNVAKLKPSIRQLIQISGMISMLIATFITSKFHDVIIFLASVFGSVALIGTLFILIKLKWKILAYMGLLNFTLVGLNFLFYFNESLISFLPILQKITFITFLFWFSIMSSRMYDLHQANSYKK
jgi:hypothetical protein